MRQRLRHGRWFEDRTVLLLLRTILLATLEPALPLLILVDDRLLGNLINTG